MQFRLVVDMDNDAFHAEPGCELARLLEAVAKRIDDALISDLLDADRSSTNVRDTNGNSVGRWQVRTASQGDGL